MNELSKKALSANEKLKSDIEMERKIEKKRIAFFQQCPMNYTILKTLVRNAAGVGEYRDRNLFAAV